MIETSDTEAEQGSRKSKVNYICPWNACGLEFRRENDFDRHYFTHTGTKKYVCGVLGCLKGYLTRDHLRRHHKISHETLSPAEIPCRDTHCEMIFTNSSNMIRHFRRKHESPRVFKCTDCQESFRRKDQLRRHRMLHTGHFPHYCNLCGKGFVNLKAIRAHKVVHRRLKCPQCDKEVNNWTELVAHRRKDHKKSFKCSSCDRKFRMKSHLSAHEVVHRAQEEQPNFTCEVCGREYNRKSNLVAHIRSTHENLRYSCTICETTLTTWRKLQLHMTKLHPNEPREPRRPPQRPRQRRKDAGEPKISMASVLADVAVPTEVEKMLLKDKGECLELDYSPVHISGSATDTESEKNLSISGGRVTFKGYI